MNAINLMKTRELELQTRLHKNYEEVWDTEDTQILSDLKQERRDIEKELGELRLMLYLNKRRQENV